MIIPVYDGYPAPEPKEPPMIPSVKEKGNVGDNPYKELNDKYKRTYPSGKDNAKKNNANDKSKCDSVTISAEGRRLYEEMIKNKQQHN